MGIERFRGHKSTPFGGGIVGVAANLGNQPKELHDLQIDRTSCNDFWANQLRVLLTAAAYVLLQELRLQAAHTN